MPLEINAVLERELPWHDVMPNEVRNMGLFDAWMDATIKGGYQWSGGNEFTEHQHTVASFLNNNATGPYFVLSGYINTRATLEFIFMERADAESFQAEFGRDFHYELNESSFAENAKVLAQRVREGDWEPADQNLRFYVHQALAATL